MKVAALLLLIVAAPASAQYANDVDRRLAIEEYHFGLQKMDAGAYEQAAAAFLRAIRHDRNLPIAYYALGQAHAARQRWDYAIEAYAGGIEALHSLDLYNVLQRGNNDNRIDVALREQAMLNNRSADPLGMSVRSGSIVSLSDRLRDTAHQQGRSFEAEFSLAAGNAFFHAGRFAEAENEWRYAVSLRPELGEAWNNLAALYVQHALKGPAEESLNAAKKAGFKVDPNLEKQIREMK